MTAAPLEKTPKNVLGIIAAAMAEPLHLPLSAGVPIYEYGVGPLGALDQWTVTYGTAAGWRASDTRRVLARKVKDVRASDWKSAGEYSPLAGSCLGNGKGAESVREIPEPDEKFADPYLRTWYVLVLSNSTGPVGYCSFSVELELVERADLMDFKLEVQEVFIDPTHRDFRHSEGFCVVIAQFAINALEEFNDRLFKGRVTFTEGVTLTVAADVESRSGERFLFSIVKELDRRAEDAWTEPESPFNLGLGLYIRDIEVDPRW
ncbi:hypothetical protein OKW43_008600 [Paraburkholderia sp. WC7.3g]|uniref:hypothetical protein n=1 Tax=Paraburkholderia sp. WC7.3g TaxID=2991070 RepID=UPI003D1DFED8